MTKSSKSILALATASMTAWGGPAAAYTLNITVTNDAPAGGFSVTPTYTAIHDGAFDAFDLGEPASPGVELLAELGDVSDLPPERLAVDPDSVATLIAAADNGIPPIEPGEAGSATLNVSDPAEARFLTYLSMLVPTNDTFLGNDDPMAYEIFAPDGSFSGALTIEVTGADLWDAGTEVNDPADGPAFVQGIDATLGTPEGGVVGPAASQVGFAGIVAANGITVDADAIDFAGDPGSFPVATITVAPIPLPGAAPLLAGGLALLGVWRLRRRG